MKRIKTEWKGIAINGWKCGKCKEEIINPMYAQKALGINKTRKCHKLKVSEKVCYIEFKKEKVNHSEHIGYTNRKEMVVIDYNKKNRIIGLELVGDKKPCQ